MLSELEAVNTMLSAIGASPVNSITGTVSADVATAKHILNEQRNAVLLKGWVFNTEEDMPLSPQSDGRIRAPQDILRIDLNTQFSYSSKINLVQRGEWLYDNYAHTYTFSAEIKVDVIHDMAWGELPQVARSYINAKATRVFLARMDADEIRFRMAAQEEQEAQATMAEAETQNGDYTIFDNEMAHRIRYRGI